MKPRAILSLALAAAALTAALPASAQPYGYRRVYYDNHRHWRCERYRRHTANQGTVIGAVSGGILGAAIGGHAGGAILGAGAGAVAGHAIASNQVHC